MNMPPPVQVKRPADTLDLPDAHRQAAPVHHRAGLVAQLYIQGVEVRLAMIPGPPELGVLDAEGPGAQCDQRRAARRRRCSFEGKLRGERVNSICLRGLWLAIELDFHLHLGVAAFGKAGVNGQVLNGDPSRRRQAGRGELCPAA